jgi:ribonuclease Z
VNPPFGDPGLFVRCRHERRALLFDLGELAPLASRELLDVLEVYVSHTHLDHFIGFDRLLRAHLAHDRPLELWGPPGILANVRGKLAGYAWNLVDGYPFGLVVHEVDEACVRSTRLSAPRRFAPEALGERAFDGRLREGSDYTVRAAHLDHRIPCLGFALEEEVRLHVRPERLAARGLAPGPWLGRLKQALRDDLDDASMLEVAHREGEPTREPLARLRDLVIAERGTRIAYVVDALFSRCNVERIVALAREADLFYCEAAFLDVDRARARDRHHLTARQAGSLARAAGARRLVPFHHSRRYGDDPAPLEVEAQGAFLGRIAPDEPGEAARAS